MERGLFPEPATDDPKQMRAFPVIAIGLVGILLLGLVGIGGLVFLRRGVEGSQAGWASWLELTRANLGQVSEPVVEGYRAGSLAIVLWAVVGSAVIAAIVGLVIARASGHSTRKRVDSLESRLQKAVDALETLRSVNQRRIDNLSEDLESLRDDGIQLPAGGTSSSFQEWRDGVDRSQKTLERDVRTLFLTLGKRRTGDDG